MFKKGYKQTEEHKAKIRKARLLNPDSFRGYKHTEEAKEKIRKTHLGVKRTFTKEHRLNLSGEKSSQWKGGVTKKYRLIRNSLEYRLWRKSVLERDNYTCIWCGNNKGGDLNADHIKPFAYFPELRFAIDNGRTLCIPCHKTTDSYLKKIKIDP